jgi:hypothetical protein
MAQPNIVPSLFGLTPELYQQNRLADLQAQQVRAGTMAAGPGTMLNPSLAPLYAQAAQQGQLQGEGLRAVGSLLGVEDPQLVKIRDVQQMRNQFDISTPDGLRSFAQALGQKGYGDLALQAANEADRITKISSEAQMSEQKISQEKKLREELNTLGENATDEDILRIVRKYGTPDQVMRAVQSSMDKKNAAAMKAAAAVNKPLPASLQKDEGKDLEAYDSYAAQKEALMPSIVNLTPDAEGVRKLQLGPLKNAEYITRNLTGNSSPESRAYEGLKSAVDTAVNLQVSAEKGVQTDKDVLRFANALIAAYGRNDTQATLEALKRYYDSVNRAQEKTAGRIESRRKSQNVEPYFQGQAVTTQPATTPQPAKTIKFNDLPK